jgi:hypothetical protein
MQPIRKIQSIRLTRAAPVDAMNLMNSCDESSACQSQKESDESIAERSESGAKLDQKWILESGFLGD